MKFDIQISVVAGIILLCMWVTIVPVGAVNNVIESAGNSPATVFIGEQGLNLTHALNQAQGAPPDGIPPQKSVGWWASAADIYTTAPSQTYDLSSSYNNFMVGSNFVGYTGTWYVLNGTVPLGTPFIVADPSLDMGIWDFDHSTLVAGSAVPQRTRLGFYIFTNMGDHVCNPAERSNLDPATDGYINIRVKDESGATITSLYNDNIGTPGAGPNSLLANYVDTSNWTWGSSSTFSWQTGALSGSTPIYPAGTYIVYAESTLHGMKDNYKNAGADYTGKTVSQVYNVTITSAQADFTFNASSGSGPVLFTDTSTGAPISWFWSFGDGGNSALQNPTHTYGALGTYPVNLTVTYSGNTPSSITKPVTVVGVTRDDARDTYVPPPPTPTEESKYASLNPIPAETILTFGGGQLPVTTPNFDGYLVASYANRRNGDGPTYLYLVTTDGTRLDLGVVQSLPTNVVFEAEDPYSETNGITSVNSGPGGVGLGALPLIPKCSGSCSNNYALLIDGGKSPDDNHIRYWNDISFMYQTLTKVYGYPKSNIRVLMSDGTVDSPADRHISTVGGIAQKDNSPRDLDSDGILETVSAANSANLQTALSTLGSGKGSSDSLFIFTTGHGGNDTAYPPGTNHAIYYLWNGAYISDSDFISYLPSTFGSITMVMEQCYSGGFIDNFLPTGYSGSQKRIIHTAANGNEPSYGNGYSNVWTRGVAMVTDNRVPSNEAEVSPYGNNNWQVAMSEICNFATAADPAATSSLANHEHPQCAKGPSTLDASTRYLISSGWITSPSVVVASPNSIETWSRGYARYITWNSKNIANVKIELYNSSSSKYYTLIGSYAASARKWNWNIPASTATGTQIYKVRISNASNASTNDMSDQYFSIQQASPGTLTIRLSPTTGGPNNNGATAATIYLDGDSIGTVTSRSSVPAGTHSITAKKDGWLDQTKGYTQLSTSTPVTFTLDLIGTNERSGLPNSAEDAGRMVITSDTSNAEVWIDGQMVGTTPYEQAIIPGTNWQEYPHKYTVTVKSVGYEPITKDIEIGRGWIVNEDFHLKPNVFFVGMITADPSDPITLTTPAVFFSAPFIYPDTTVSHTAMWNWGDGSAESEGTVTEADNLGLVTGSHSYSSAGVYQVTLTVTDSLSIPKTSSYQYVVVYDPNAGFVTGNGWINSPSGAYIANPGLNGEATFGFVSNYLKGAKVPAGNTEFQFKFADLNFHSDTCEWLVVNKVDQKGTSAQYKGVGTINGVGEYKFIIWGFDGSQDTFRIKLWTESKGKETVVYDNGREQAIGGGSIIIRSK